MIFLMLPAYPICVCLLEECANTYWRLAAKQKIDQQYSVGGRSHILAVAMAVKLVGVYFWFG